MRSLFTSLPLVLLLAATLTGCGGSESSPDSTTDQSSSSSTEQTASSGDADRTVTLHPVDNQMRYEETEFTVEPGQTIKLVFENTATSPSMQHNVVVLNDATDALFQRIGEAGMQAGAANEYVPEDDAIIAYTPMSKPGETVSVTFTVPEETGEYGYVCTFPGHWATMQGTMYVKEDGSS